MPTTPNHGIFYADTGTNASLATITSTMASSVESALDAVDTNLEKYGITQVANYAALTAFTNYETGTRVYVIDEETTYLKQASGWIPWDSNWITWGSPINSGLTLGTDGTVSAKYRYASGAVILDFFAQLGSSGFTVGSITLTLPVTAETRSVNGPRYVVPGNVIYGSASTVAMGVAHMTQAGVGIILGAMNTGGSYVTRSVTSATVPFTWAAGDTVYFSGIYAPAALE